MDISGYIDHTYLKPDCTAGIIKNLCKEAVDAKFAAVCIPPYYVKLCVDILEGTGVKIATVIGFPMGYSATVSKVEEIKRAISEGAHEVDVVINVSAVKNGDWTTARHDIDRMTTAAHLKGKVIKVILETALLTEAEIKKLTEICTEQKVDFVKTSTGYNGGATLDVVKLLAQNLPEKIKIKASGGIRSREEALLFIEAGAHRIGTSSGLSIIGKN